jgi:magnesium-transporting ATPase (P-type)
MCFEMVADIRRHGLDKKTNNFLVETVCKSGGKFTSAFVKTQDLKVGHIIKLKNKEWIPADCIILETGAPNGICYISTETLDGERNLKPKFSPESIQGKLLESGSTAIEYIDHVKDIYNFSGKIGGNHGLEYKHFVPRGSMLVHSEEVYAVVLYTGAETKQVMNQGMYKYKISLLQKEINRYMIISFILIICIMILMSQVMNRVWHKTNIKGEKLNHFYLIESYNDSQDEDFDFNQTSINALFSFFLLSNSFIPLNMAVINFLTWYFYSLLSWADP